MKTDSKLLLFVMGAVAVFLALKIEKSIFNGLVENATPLIIFRWALAEEVVKFLPLLLVKRDNLQNVLWYAVMIALGFAITENILFAKTFINTLNPNMGALIGLSSRIDGATFMHILMSLILGWIWYKKPRIIFFGILLTTVLHTLFNLSVFTGQSHIVANMWIAEIIFVLIWLVFSIRKFFSSKFGIAGIIN